VYIEVWPPDNEFADLQRIIEGAQALGGGKAVVLAAYISPAQPANVRLADAVILASGGAHIELGERTGGAPNMLADPYFPKHEALTLELGKALLRQVNFAVRYQGLLGPRTSAAPALAGQVQLRGAESDRVSVIARQGAYGSALSLVNFSGLAHTCWNQPLGGAPCPVVGLRLELLLSDQVPAAVYYASPDLDSLELIHLPFNVSAGRLAVELPELAYWGTLFIQWM
jgi:dextranase